MTERRSKVFKTKIKLLIKKQGKCPLFLIMDTVFYQGIFVAATALLSLGYITVGSIYYHELCEYNLPLFLVLTGSVNIIDAFILGLWMKFKDLGNTGYISNIILVLWTIGNNIWGIIWLIQFSMISEPICSKVLYPLCIVNVVLSFLLFIYRSYPYILWIAAQCYSANEVNKEEKDRKDRKDRERQDEEKKIMKDEVYRSGYIKIWNNKI